VQLSGDNICAGAGMTFELVSNGNVLAQTKEGPKTSNRTTTLTLATPLESSVQTISVSYTMCSKTMSPLTVTVSKEPLASLKPVPSISPTDTNIQNDSTSGVATDAGLSGGWIAGIAILVVAFLGFLAECFLHKRAFRAHQRDLQIESSLQ
jgi:hypothetical protein